MKRQTSRREFLQASAVAGVGFWVGGSAAGEGKSANGKINIAGIGVGGKGESDILQAANNGNVVAICDIDDNNLGKAYDQLVKKGHNPKKYSDFRKMYDEMEKQIDAVTVSTPDHTHAVASLMGMKRGKHVYCQKPLTHDVAEARQMRETATQMKVCTQMGNQGTAGHGLRRAAELIQSGLIGPVTEVHVWTNRPIWPQAPQVTARPKDTPPVPSYVHWDEFLGPAPERPYNKAYHPFAWRGWWDFGTGALGDMACHTANLPFMALKLGYPTSVIAECGDLNPETYPSWARVHFEFPTRESMPALKFTWYEGHKDGKTVLPAPELVKGMKESDTGFAIYHKDGTYHFRNGKSKEKVVSSGSFMIGEKGIVFSPDDYGGEAFILAGGEIKKIEGQPERLPRNGHGDDGMKEEWVRAIKENSPKIALSNFDYAALLTETILLGNVAIRMMGQKLEWDGPHMRFTNNSGANQYLKREYRKGWEV